MKTIQNVWNWFRGTLRGFDTPRQLALGVTFGMLIGLLPKDSAIPYLIGIVAILSNANLLSIALSGLLFSWIGPLLDPLTHSIGHWILTFDPFEPALAWLYQLPGAPWTRIDNTVVAGSMLVGLLLALPVHSITQQTCERFGTAIYQKVLNNRLVQWLIGSHSKTGTSETHNLQQS